MGCHCSGWNLLAACWYFVFAVVDPCCCQHGSMQTVTEGMQAHCVPEVMLLVADDSLAE
jgi:hypothetical protein